MAAVLLTPEERARKATTLVFQRLQPDGTQRNVAQAWGVSESTVSRLKEHIEPVMRLVSQLGLKLVPAEAKCYPPEELNALLHLARGRLSAISNADQLSWDE